MTFEDMQRKFIVPDQDQYSWFLVGNSQKMTKIEVAEKIVSIEGLTKHFIHKDKYIFYVGLGLGETLPDGLFDYVDPVDPPVVEEPTSNTSGE